MSFNSQILAALPQNQNLFFLRGDLVSVTDFKPQDGDKTFYTAKVAAIGATFALSLKDRMEFEQIKQLEGQEVGIAATLGSKDGKSMTIGKIVDFASMEHHSANAQPARRERAAA